jgi:predicted SnoaL-like aldol condensation-catalyzing enzyme
MSDLEINKRVVVDYYQTAFDGNPEKGSCRFLRRSVHPAQPGCRKRSQRLHRVRNVAEIRASRDLTLDIKRVIAEGDMVATHSHLVLDPGQPGRALADFFRLESGKVVEHWDVIQEVPEKAANANGMF